MRPCKASKGDGWDTEPFTLVHDKQTDRLIGRGSTDDKGPVLGWLAVRFIKFFKHIRSDVWLLGH